MTSKNSVSIGNKVIAYMLSFSMLFNLGVPNFLYGQSSSGPKSGSSSGSSSVGGGYTVDPFTGDFSYSIPLLKVGGYPLTIHYDPNISMSTEASWVGLGWNLNVGSVDREMRGVPDDFKGDEINSVFSQKPNETVGKAKGADFSTSAAASVGIGTTGATEDDYSLVSVFGGIGLKLSGMSGSYTNTYRGIGYTNEFSINGTLFGGFNAVGAVSGVGGVTGGTGYSVDNQNGSGMSYTAGAFGSINLAGQTVVGGASVNTKSYNTRTGTETKTYLRSTTVMNKTSVNKISRSFGTKSFMPKLGYNAFNMNFSSMKGRGAYLNGGFSVGIVGISLGIEVKDMKKSYTFNTPTATHTEETPAYGYLQMDQRSPEDTTAILDFNREKEQLVTEDTKRLPVTVPTYDLFRVNNGIYSGTFRAHRGDVGTFTDPKSVHAAMGFNILDIESYGLFYKETKGVPKSTTLKETGRYEDELTAAGPGTFGYFRFRTGNESQIYEKYYFKKVGELTPTNMELWDQYNGFNASSLTTIFNTDDEYEDAGYLSSDNGLTSLSGNNYLDSREVRRDYFKVYTPVDFTLRNWNTKFKSYGLFDAGSDNYTSNGSTDIDRTDDYREEHHISMISVTDGSGMQYKYGIPVYSVKEDQVSFSISENAYADYSDVETEGLVGYNRGNPSYDNSVDNRRGRRHLYNKTTTPAYASSHLLTEILSPDYVDKTNDGPTPDDIGNYVKFNYTNVFGPANPYKWRLPYKNDVTGSLFSQAYFNEGIKGDPYDDKAYYLYGEKEVWYPQSIVTKNYVVEFYLSNRQDAHSVLNENGDVSSGGALKKLDKIVVYALEDRMNNGQNATPLKTIEFDYDYSLCQNFPLNNSGGGKLTLKEITIYTGDSKEKKISPYVFEYLSSNPSYSPSAVDKWTNYKYTPGASIYPNSVYPYSTEDESDANSWATAWKLTKITTPTKKEITVSYEADRYSHVQDQRTMKFFNILGAATEFQHGLFNTIDNYSDPGDEPFSLPHLRNMVNRKDPAKYLYFRLDEEISLLKSSAEDLVGIKYFGDVDPEVDNPVGNEMNEMLFKFQVGMTAHDDYDNIKGFAQIEEYGVVGQSPPFNFGYIKLKTNLPALEVQETKKKSYQMSPIQKSALQHLRLNTPYKIFASTFDDPYGGPIHIYHTNYDKELKKGNAKFFNDVLNEEAKCFIFNPTHSWVRLYEPDREKFGGNYRVKEIAIKDNWDQMTGEYGSEYVTEYHYSNKEGTSSAGIASYEPQLGKDESPFYLPIAYAQENKYHPDDHHYQLLPYGESYFPGPVVGYPKVMIKRKDITNVTKNTTGQKVYTFHTAKDYPYKVENYENEIFTSSFFSTIEEYDKDTGEGFYKHKKSQGYLIETNDMHGKPETVTTRNRDGGEVSKTKYTYYDFYEKQPVLNDEAEREQRFLGKDYDITVDHIASRMTNREYGDIKSIEYPTGIIPIKNDATLHSLFVQEMRALVMTKSINHTAIPKKVETTYLGNKSTFVVEAYDHQSGQNIVSRVPNEYEHYSDNVRDIVLPAHWKYKRLNSKYVNDGYYEDHASIFVDTYGKLTGLTHPEYFLEGDYVLVYTSGGTERYHVTKWSGDVYLIDENGEYVDGAQQFYIIRILESGNENRSVEAMASYKTHADDPFATNNNLTIDDNQVLSASAVEYNYNTGLICQDAYRCGDEPSNCGYLFSGDPINPFINGMRTTLRPTKSYMYQINLANNTTAQATDIRDDGVYSSFVPFYEINAGEWYDILESNHPDYTGDLQEWRPMGEISRWDEFGRVVDSKNPIGVHSATQYGYNGNLKLLPKATASNAKLRQIGFDGFEDYEYQSNQVNCDVIDHFSLREAILPSKIEVTDKERHTGKNSLFIERSNVARMNRIINDCDPKNGPYPLFSKDGFIPVDCNCIEKFAPTEGNYLASVWVKVVGSEGYENYISADMYIRITYGGGSSNTFYFTQASPIIDGWQKFEVEYTVPADPECFDFFAINTQQDMYLDDLRTHPFKATMNTMVYDNETLLPTASHDNYNFSTFFQYDKALNRVGIKVETVEGIHSVNETRSGIAK